MENKKKLLAIGILGFIVLAIFLLFYTSVGINHIYHLATGPQDLHIPIIEDNFNFSKKNNSKQYVLTPKYKDIYEIAVAVPPNTIPSGYNNMEYDFQLTGIIKAEFYIESKKVNEMILSNEISIYYQKNNMDFIKEISLGTFKLPINKFNRSTTNIKLTVIKPYELLNKYQDRIKLIIRVSPKP